MRRSVMKVYNDVSNVLLHSSKISTKSWRSFVELHSIHNGTAEKVKPVMRHVCENHIICNHRNICNYAMSKCQNVKNRAGVQDLQGWYYICASGHVFCF